jgi:ABC-type transport system substrate-binding protein
MGYRLAYLFGYGDLYGKYDDIQVLWNKYQESYDPKERKTLITRVQNMYHDRTMFIPLVAVSSPSAIGPRPKGSLWRIKPHLMWWVSPMEELELNSYD